MITNESDFTSRSLSGNGQNNTRDAKWMANYEALKAHVAETGHFANKHTRLNAFVKYTRKKLNAGTLEEWKKELFLELAESRSDSHTGGRKKKPI